MNTVGRKNDREGNKENICMEMIDRQDRYLIFEDFSFYGSPSYRGIC
jgi:hypothetical protein